MSASGPLPGVARWKELERRILATALQSDSTWQNRVREFASKPRAAEIDSTALIDPEAASIAQIRGLVRTVFLSGFPIPARQIVFSAVDQNTDINGLCRMIARTLAEEVRSDVCLVEAPAELGSAQATAFDSVVETTGAFRQTGEQLCANLWRVPSRVFAGTRQHGSRVLESSRTLEHLRSEFEYCVIQSPMGTNGPATLLGQLCDGVVLVLQANSTRRLAAQRTKEVMRSANVRILGTILCERTFPIPESIYRKI